MECSVCKINFGDVISAQKHFDKFHKYSDSKDIMNIKHGNDSTPTPLTTSQRKVFDDIKNIHSCNYCGYAYFSFVYSVNSTFSKLIPTFCSYKTRWISELERHVRVHSKEKPFKCGICDFKSKWKGDLNRHVQRYHSGTVPDGGDSDASGTNYATGSNSHNSDVSPSGVSSHHHHHSSDNHQKGSSFMAYNDEAYGNNSYEGSVEADESEMMMATTSNGIENGDGEHFDLDNEEEDGMLHSPGGNGVAGTAKMYKCTYCDFMCSTASRFHVHYVQHLNTKPFQCSICGHRSNWEWDVTKHIKMKAQRDPNHVKARPVLIHDSGRRDYSKYSKFVVYVDQAEADLANNEASKIDFRAKRFRPDSDEFGAPEDGMAVDNNLLMPEVCFEEVDGEATDLTNPNASPDNSTIKQQLLPNKSKYGVATTPTSTGSSPSVTTKSVIVSRHANSRNRHKHIFCEVCHFKHAFSRVVVAHMSHHAECKPYACKQCSCESNWREVLINHNRSQHADTDPLDFEMRFRCAIDENGVCRILKLSPEEIAQLEMEASAAACNDVIIEPAVTTATPTPTATAENTNSSLIEPNIYEEKAVIRCQMCPFLTTNHKKMSIHCRFHNPSKGSLKCSYCPYFVNNREKLLRHQKLHQKHSVGGGGGHHSHSRYIQHSNIKPNPSLHFKAPTFGHNAHHHAASSQRMISCSMCPFRAISIQVLTEHMKLHKSGKVQGEYNNNDHQDQYNEALLEQSMEENNGAANMLSSSHYSNGYAENSASLVDSNNMKNGSAKKFSYVCSGII